MNPRGLPIRLLHRALSAAAIATTASAVAIAHHAAAQQTTPHTASGLVVDQHTGQPIAAARIAIQGSSLRAASDESGQFTIPIATRPNTRLTAWAPGYYIAGADAGTQPVTLRLHTHPRGDSTQYQWIDPGPDRRSQHNCANCHAGIYRQWSTSSHARAAVNKHFLDMFAGTDWSGRPGVGWNFSRDHPEARPVCAACHVPTVPGDDPAAEDPARARAVTREGIHCDFCHKVAEIDLGPDLEFLGLQHGRDALRLVRPADDRQVFFGPLDDVDRGKETFAPVYRSSLYCASCHEGTLFGTRVYETYSEWAGSSFARQGIQCQDCHMKPDGVTRNIAPGHGGMERDPDTLSTHHFPGSADPAFLQNSVRLELTGERQADSIRVDVSLESVQVGHRLPTGSPDRHLLLVVRARDGQGRPLARRSGPVIGAVAGVGTAARGEFAGSPGKLYGKILHGPGGSTPVPFWQAVGVLDDTRLQPGAADLTRFAFELSDSPAPWRVEATVLYRRFFKSVLNEKGWPDQDVVLATREIVLDGAGQ